MKRKPAKLSGGERQRVALGRAIVRDPKAYLFDEPISALDALLRLEMRTELKRLQRDLGRTLVYVTHDQVEAMSMADRILVLREGIVQQIDTPERDLPQPRQPLRGDGGRLAADELHARDRQARERLAEGNPRRVRVPHARRRDTDQLKDGDACWIGIRPEDIKIETSGEEGVPAKVYVTEPLGGETVVDLQFGDRIYKALAPPTLKLAQDQEVRARLDRTARPPVHRGRRRRGLRRGRGRLRVRAQPLIQATAPAGSGST